MKKSFRVTSTIIGIIILLPIVAVIAAVCLFYYPPFQNWAVKQVTSYASESMGMDITVDHVSLAFPFDLAVEDVKVLRASDSLPNTKDTIADIKKTLVNIDLLPLLHQQVEVNKIELQSAKFNTTNLIGSACVKGHADKLALKSHGINLASSTVRLNEVQLANADVDVQLSDTVPEDTTKTENIWKIYLDNLHVDNSNVTVHMPGDTLAVSARLGQTDVKDASFDLYKGQYDVSKFDWTDGAVTYDNNFAPRILAGFDYNHLSLDSIEVGIDSLHYCSPLMTMNIRKGKMKERSGLDVTQLLGKVYMDSVYVSVQNLVLNTPFSSVSGSVNMDFDAFDQYNPGKLFVKANASIGRNDLMLFAKPYLPNSIARQWPYAPLRINTIAQGNMQCIDITSLAVDMPTVFNANLVGHAYQYTNIDNLRADLSFNVATYNLSMLTSMLDRELMKTICIPSGIKANGKLNVEGPVYDAKLLLQQAGGKADVLAHFDSKAMRYKANVNASQLVLRNFLPSFELSPFTGSLSVDGQGTDPNRSMNLTAHAKVSKLAYAEYDVSGTTADVSVNNGNIAATINLANKMLSGTASVQANINSADIISSMHYKADIRANSLPVQKFLPNMGLTPFSGHIVADGQGINPYRSMHLTAHADIDRFQYTDFDISGTSASVTVNNGNVDASAQLANKMLSGTASVQANINDNDMLSHMRYSADINAQAFPVQKLLPGMGLTAFTGHIKADGRGINPYDDMVLTADADIARFKYTDFDLSGSSGTVTIGGGKVEATANLHNRKVSGTVSVGGMLKSKDIRATLGCDLDYADLYALNITDVPLQTSLCAHVDVATDMNEYYMVNGFVSDVVIVDSLNTYRPNDLTLDIFTRQDTTWAKVNSGDFDLDMTASGGYKKLMKVADNLSAEVLRQLNNKSINQDSLKMVLPVGHFALSSGNDNFLYRYASSMGYSFRKLNADFTTSPVAGINGTATADSLVVNGMQFDIAKIDLKTDGDGFRFNGHVQNYKDNPELTFKALFNGNFVETGANMNVSIYDSDDKLGIQTGLKANIEDDGIRLQMNDQTSILGYRKFTANKDNYVYLSKDNRVSAYLLLKDDSGTGIHIYSDDDNTDALQDITIGVNHLDLTSIVSLLPYFPSVTGVLDGDFHLIQTPDELSVSSSLGIDKFVYEGNAMGDLASEFVYIPKEDGSHYVDGILIHDGDEVGTIKGTYSTEGKGYLDAKFHMKELPLNMVNSFIPDQIVGLKGFGNGTVDIQGPLSNLDVDGTVNLKSAYLESVPYGVEMRFDDRPVRIQNSRLLLENFNMYAHNDQPLTINGYVDFTDVANMSMNVQMSAKNFLLIDSKQNRKSEVYGKTYVNFNALMTGRIEALQVRGRLDVLGNTDMTYILKDSPLTTDNRMDGLVEFSDFAAEETEAVVRPTLDGIYMDMQISIAQGAHLVCALNAAKSNYVDLFGGGDLRLVYSDDEMRLTGRYTLNSGEMKYSLPVIPLQTFTIQDGSYVEFTGEVMNPTLNITATENIKSMVNGDGNNRNVSFETGVVITKTLNDMGLEFIIDAPEDMQIHGELQTMSIEERGKLAVTMLTTGMYLSDNNMSSFTMNSALSSFLQSEINSITGNALRTLDLSIGLDNTTDATGALHTDYSFKFAKRFWNNRIKVVVGGKVSTDDALNQNLFDNVAFEYRLDQSANTNLKLFYDRSVYDYLEGNVGQYGVGIVWKRKLEKFSDIFRLKTPSFDPEPYFNNNQSIIPMYINTDTIPTSIPVGEATETKEENDEE